MILLPSQALTTRSAREDQIPAHPRRNPSTLPVPLKRLKIIARILLRLGTKTTLIPKIRLATTHSNDYVKLGSLRRLFQSSSFTETISSLRSAHVLRAALNTAFKTTALQLKARRRSSQSFSRPAQGPQAWVLRTSTTPTRS